MSKEKVKLPPGFPSGKILTQERLNEPGVREAMAMYWTDLTTLDKDQLDRMPNKDTLEP